MNIIRKTEKKLAKAGYKEINVEQTNGSIRLSGSVYTYQNKLECGKLAIEREHSRGVINDIKVVGLVEPTMRISEIKDNLYDGLTPDVVIVGAGIVGAAIARELSRYNLDIMLLEKEYDVATGQSCRNDGMIHAGIDLKPSSKKIKYNMRGNALYDELSKELDVPIKKTGQYVLFTNRFQKYLTPFIKMRGKINNIPVEKVTKAEMSKKVPNPGLNYGGIFCAGAGVVSPYLMTIALAENAVSNGVKLCLNTAVTDITNDGSRVTSVVTNRGAIYPKALINAAGVYCDVIAEKAGDRHFTVHPRRGVEIILDKKANTLTDAVVGKFVLKSSTGKSHTKGGGIVRTIDDNILVGPSATETYERENTATTAEEMDEVFDKQKTLTPNLKRSDIITYFAGARAATYEEEFIVEKSPVIANLIQTAGIQSPGVTAAPAIAQDVAKYTLEVLNTVATVTQNATFNPIRKGIPCLREMNVMERNNLIHDNPNYGEIVCRCEEISKGEILDCLHRPFVVPTIDAIKRRVRAGMGRCQGGFCSPIITKIIATECQIPLTAVKKKGEHSEILLSYTKKGASDERI